MSREKWNEYSSAATRVASECDITFGQYRKQGGNSKLDFRQLKAFFAMIQLSLYVGKFWRGKILGINKYKYF